MGGFRKEMNIVFGLKGLSKRNDQELLNRNIEVINPNLYALKFSHIPYIKEIDYKPYEDIPAYHEPMRIDRANGIILINKDHAGYELVKNALVRAMSKPKNGQLERELLLLKKQKNKDKYTIFYESALMVELERRLYSEKAVL